MVADSIDEPAPVTSLPGRRNSGCTGPVNLHAVQVPTGSVSRREEKQLLPIRGPADRQIGRWVIRNVSLAGTVGGHDVHFLIAVAVGRKGDSGTVWRPEAEP
jgi:hypothetical protein